MWNQILEKMTAQILSSRKYILIAVLLELPWQEDAKTSVCSNQPQPNPFQPVKPRRGAWGIGAWRLPSLCLQLPGVLLHLPEHRHLCLLPHHRHHLDGRQLMEYFCINSLSFQGDVLAGQQVDENLDSVCSLLRHLCLPWLHPWGALRPDYPWLDSPTISPDSSSCHHHHSGKQLCSHTLSSSSSQLSR